MQWVYAESDTIRLEFDHFAQGPKYYSSGDWYVALINEDDWEVYLNWKAPADDYTGRFMANKFLHDYSYIFTPENRENGGIHFKNIIMMIETEALTPLLEKIEINATINMHIDDTYAEVYNMMTISASNGAIYDVTGAKVK